MSKEKKLINKIVKNYNVDGTIFISKGVKVYGHCEGVDVVFSCSMWVDGEIITLDAVTFYSLSKLMFATLDAKGLKK